MEFFIEISIFFSVFPTGHFESLQDVTTKMNLLLIYNYFYTSGMTMIVQEKSTCVNLIS